MLVTGFPAGASREAEEDALTLRLARYGMARAEIVMLLLQRLATIPETIELARTTGITCPQALYNAQMLRVWSLLVHLLNTFGTPLGAQNIFCLSKPAILYQLFKTLITLIHARARVPLCCLSSLLLVACVSQSRVVFFDNINQDGGF